VPAAEIEAARACGLSTLTACRLVILPRAFSIALPAYSNEVIILMKGNALASTITLVELMVHSQLISSKTYQPIQVFVIAGLIYYALTLVISRIFVLHERRCSRYVRLAR
jgi:putative lysine/arginine/ornithine/histidine/octopine transport system permease protein